MDHLFEPRFWNCPHRRKSAKVSEISNTLAFGNGVCNGVCNEDFHSTEWCFPSDYYKGTSNTYVDKKWGEGFSRKSIGHVTKGMYYLKCPQMSIREGRGQNWVKCGPCYCWMPPKTNPIGLCNEKFGLPQLG